MKLTELFKDESEWTKGENARDANGFKCSYDSPMAVCWCITGRAALHRVSSWPQILDAIKDLFPDRNLEFIHKFNDHRLTTFADVQAVLARAEELRNLPRAGGKGDMPTGS